MTAALARAMHQDSHSAAVAGDLQVAKDYETYLQNSESINMMLALNPDSAFAAGWELTLLRAQELGLNTVKTGPGYTAKLQQDIPLASGNASEETVYDGSGSDVQQIWFYADGTQAAADGQIFNVTAGNLTFGDYTLDTVVGSFNSLASGTGSSVTIQGSGNFIAVSGDQATVTLDGSGSGNVVQGGAGAETFTISGQQLGNTLIAGGDANTLVGNGRGNVLNLAGTHASVRYDVGNATIDLLHGTGYVTGSGIQDNLVGTVYNAIVGGTNAHIIGANYSQTLTALGFHDTVDTGSAGDLIVLGGTAATVNGNALTTVSFAQAQQAVSVNLATGVMSGGAQDDVLNGINSVAGSHYDDVLVGSASGGSALSGGGGNDTLTATGSNNFLQAGDGDDTLTVTGNSNILRGGSGSGKLQATGSFNSLYGGSGSDTLAATGAGNTLYGGSGTTTFHSDAGGNTLVGGTGRSIASYPAANLTVDVVNGAASVNGSGVADTLSGVSDVVVSGAGDRLITAAGAMELDTFTAVESATGDKITGVLFDNTNRYTVGSSVTSGIDTEGGTWTYTIDSIATTEILWRGL